MSNCSTKAMETASSEIMNAPQQTFEARQWWRSVQDQSLNVQVDAARQKAFSVLRAGAISAESAAYERRASSILLPSLNTNAQTTQTELNSSNSLSLDLNWQIDVFGRYRNALKAGQLKSQANEALIVDAQRLIASETVSSYISLAGFKSEISLAKQSVSRLEDTISKIKRLAGAGYATQLDVHRSEVQLLDAKANISQLQASAKSFENRLKLLTASEPLGVISTDIFETLLNLNLAIPEPEKLINNRSDIRAANLMLLAAAAEVAAAKGQLLPDLSIDGRLFLTDDDNRSFSPTDFTSNIISRLSMPILGRGRILADIDANNARLQQAKISYDETVQTALLEIDTAYNQAILYRQAAQERKQAVASAQTALSQSLRLFDAGEIVYLDVLLAEQALSDAEREQLRSAIDAGQAWTTLNTALASY